ncbi:hypothetical protein C8R45DRAFT_1110857 [Mycena sanguinolenta]|nr:hypothetical protein C8R45DRAFT_1110857 [Mycena sanguinolenta]
MELRWRIVVSVASKACLSDRGWRHLPCTATHALSLFLHLCFDSWVLERATLPTSTDNVKYLWPLEVPATGNTCQAFDSLRRCTTRSAPHGQFIPGAMSRFFSRLGSAGAWGYAGQRQQLHRDVTAQQVEVALVLEIPAFDLVYIGTRSVGVCVAFGYRLSALRNRPVPLLTVIALDTTLVPLLCHTSSLLFSVFRTPISRIPRSPLRSSPSSSPLCLHFAAVLFHRPPAHLRRM